MSSVLILNMLSGVQGDLVLSLYTVTFAKNQPGAKRDCHQLIIGHDPKTKALDAQVYLSCEFRHHNTWQ